MIRKKCTYYYTQCMAYYIHVSGSKVGIKELQVQIQDKITMKSTYDVELSITTCQRMYELVI